MPWYLLPVSSQKQVCAAIYRMQNGVVLTIGPLGVIDFRTASNVGLFSPLKFSIGFSIKT